VSVEIGVALLHLVFIPPMALWILVRIRKLRVLQREGVAAKGWGVTSGTTRQGSYSVVEFVSLDGVTRMFKMRGSLSGEVDLVYNPGKPKRVMAVRDLGGIWRYWFLMMLLAAVFLGWAMVALAEALR